MESMQGLPILGRVYANKLPEILKIIKMYHLCLGSSKFLREPIYINVYSENVCSVPYNYTLYMPRTITESHSLPLVSYNLFHY